MAAIPEARPFARISWLNRVMAWCRLSPKIPTCRFFAASSPASCLSRRMNDSWRREVEPPAPPRIDYKDQLRSGSAGGSLDVLAGVPDQRAGARVRKALQLRFLGRGS